MLYYYTIWKIYSVTILVKLRELFIRTADNITNIELLICVHFESSNDVKILHNKDRKSCSYKQPVCFIFIFGKWELLHPVRLVCLTSWVRSEPRRGLGNCALIQQVNRSNPTWRIVIFSSDRGLSHSGPTLDPNAATPLVQIVTTPHEKYVSFPCP